MNILRAGRLHDVRVTLHAGEILGVGGLQGQGQSELLLALFGAFPLETGEVRLEGHTVHFRHPRDAMRAGVAYVPGDRNREGCWRRAASSRTCCCPPGTRTTV
ncbi:MAG: ATP-binding cassette domain-containing protein [Pleurocapsa sp. SU_196_0]|nr:ATP-binding cassette domain-containing protein [Pleurocapsa sp. SU_196_0]